MADLITVNEYKDAEGLRGEKDDDRLAVIVPQVSDLVKKYCGISFVDYFSTNKVEIFNIDDTHTSTIIMSESPLVTVDSVEERTTFSPDALTGLEANLRFPGKETCETKIFGRLTAWQNWIFNRPNAVSEKGALKLFGTGSRAKFDNKRV